MAKCTNPGCKNRVRKIANEIDGRLVCFPCWCEAENAKIAAWEALTPEERKANLDQRMLETIRG